MKKKADNTKTEEKEHMETKWKCLLCDEMIPLSDDMCEDCYDRAKSSYYEW